jgi:hypothetical protein
LLPITSTTFFGPIEGEIGRKEGRKEATLEEGSQDGNLEEENVKDKRKVFTKGKTQTGNDEHNRRGGGNEGGK